MSRLSNINKSDKRLVYERTRVDKEPFRYGGLVIFAVLVLMGALGYLIFFSGSLDIKNVAIEGYSKPEDLQKIAQDFRDKEFLGNNILFIRSGALEERLQEDSRIVAAKVVRDWPNNIKIIITESKGALLWETKGEQFLIDERGYVIDKNINYSFPLVFDNSNIEVSPGERVASPTFIKYIKDLSQNFELVTGQAIEKIIIFDIFSEVHVKSKSTWTVYLDTTKDPQAQLENLNKVLQTAAGSGHKNLQYIDMRLQDRIFYK